MIWILFLFLAAIFLSAFFSGMETGFYRATRVRLVLAGMSGDTVARRLLWMTNNPTLSICAMILRRTRSFRRLRFAPSTPIMLVLTR